MRLRRILPWLALLLACWCPLGMAAPAPTVITFWHAMRSSRGEALHRLVERFNQLNPDLQVEEKFVGSDQDYGNDYHALYQSILKALADHQPPDVAQVYENWTAQLISVQAVAAIQPFLQAGDRVDDLVPVFRTANTFDGTLYTMPFNKSIYVLYYNPRLVPEAPRTLQALRDTARQVAQEHPGVYGLAFQPGVDIFGDLLYANGGNFFDSANHAAFSTPAGVSALQALQDMTLHEHSALAAWDAERYFTSGKAAMFVFSTTAQVDMAKTASFPFQVAPLPSGAARAYQFAGTNLAILAPTARQAAAARLIRFLTSTDNTVTFATETGYLPVHESALHNPAYLRFLQLHPGFKAGLDALPYARIQPRISAWENVRGILDDAVYAAVSNPEDVGDILQRAAARSDELIDKLQGR